MGRPIIPNPMNAIFMSFSFLIEISFLTSRTGSIVRVFPPVRCLNQVPSGPLPKVRDQTPAVPVAAVMAFGAPSFARNAAVEVAPRGFAVMRGLSRHSQSGRGAAVHLACSHLQNPFSTELVIRASAIQ